VSIKDTFSYQKFSIRTTWNTKLWNWIVIPILTNICRVQSLVRIYVLGIVFPSWTRCPPASNLRSKKPSISNGNKQLKVAQNSFQHFPRLRFWWVIITTLYNIGILSKLRYYVNSDILVKLYYALIYPFLTYGLISWGNTYSSTTQPLFILRKRAMRVMTFSKFHEHSSPIFKHLNIVKLPDLVFLNIAVFMYTFHNRRLPSVFDTFFTQVNKRHNYNTRSASNMFYTLPKVRPNYGIFNIRFRGPKVWNSISENLKTFSNSNFKESVKSDLVKDY